MTRSEEHLNVGTETRHSGRTKAVVAQDVTQTVNESVRSQQIDTATNDSGGASHHG